MPNEIKLCKDCQYYRDPIIRIGDDEISTLVTKKINHSGEAMCWHPDFLSLVDGSVTMRCEIARDFNRFCGRRASKFLAKVPEATEPDFEVVDD